MEKPLPEREAVEGRPATEVKSKTPKISDGFRSFYILKITANIFIRLFDLSFDFCNFAAWQKRKP